MTGDSSERFIGIDLLSAWCAVTDTLRQMLWLGQVADKVDRWKEGSECVIESPNRVYILLSSLQ